ncbi:DUF4347 domain-containing protein, partial [Bordetella avium]
MSIKKLARKLWTGASSREVQQSLFRRRPLFEALERRYLMSAELVLPPAPQASDEAPIVAPAHPDQAHPQAKKPSAPGTHPYLVERAAFQQSGTLGESMSLGQYAQAAQAAKAGLPAEPGLSVAGYTTQSAQTPVRQIIFVDPSIDNAEQMVQGLYSLLSGKTEGLGGLATPTGEGPQLQVLRSHDTEIIVLDGRYDGVDQITQVLAQHKDLAALQIMSHGSAGSLSLGSASLGEGGLDAYKNQLRAWGDAMAEGGDILLYGCNVAAGRGGVKFIDSLSAITRADVAAATHSVGSAALGGDWLLDYRHGSIEATTLTVAPWDGLMATSTGLQTGGSTLTAVATHDKLLAYGSDNTFVFNNSSTATTTTIELRQGMKQENGVWVRNADDENSNNTLDFSAIKGNVTAIISNQDSYQIRYSTVDGNNNWTEHTVNVVFKSADGSQSLKIGDKTFNLVGTSQSGKTLLDYSGYATGVTVDLSGPTAGGNSQEVPPPTGFGYVRAIGAIKGSAQGGNRITVVGGTTVTITTAQDIIKSSGGGNTFIVGANTFGFSLTQQAGQSGNTLDLSQFGADITARVLTQGGVTVYMGAGVDSTGAQRNFSGATALVSNLDIQIFVGVEGKTTLDYSAYEANVTVNLNYQDEATALYDATGMAGVMNVSNVIGAGGLYSNDIVGSLGDNIITVAHNRGVNRIAGGGGNDLIFGNGSLSGGSTEYVGGVKSDAVLTGGATSALLTTTPPGASTAQTVRLYGVNAVTLQDYRTINNQAAAGAPDHARTLVTLDGSGYSGDLTLIGSAGDNILRGGLGHNVFTGYQGDNELWAQSAAKSNTLSEKGNWNFQLSETALTAVYAGDGSPVAIAPVLSNRLYGRFTDAELNGGLNASAIDASAFQGNTVLVSGLMAAGVIKAGSGAGSRHQIILLGGSYDITGGSGAGASTELVVLADGLTGATDEALRAALLTSQGAGWLALRDSGGVGGWDGWIQRDASASSGSNYRNITSAKVLGGEYRNWIDTSAFKGVVTIDAHAGTDNTFVIGNTHASNVIGSAGENRILVATGNNDLRLSNGELTFTRTGGQVLVSTFTRVKDFSITVQGDGRKVDTTGFSGLTTQSYLKDLGYQSSTGPALSVVFPNAGNARVDIGLEGVSTIQGLLDAIKAGVMVNAAGQPIRIAVEGPNAGKPLPASDTSTRWDYLYALEAGLSADGRLEIRYSQAARDAGYSGAFTLMPGMRAKLNADGTVSSSTVVLSQAAHQLGLLAGSELQRKSDANGVFQGAVLAIAHNTEFILAGANAQIRSGGGENTFSIQYGTGNNETGGGNRIIALAGAVNHLVVNTTRDVVLSPSVVRYVSGGVQGGIVYFAPGVMTDATLIAVNESGRVTLDASTWTAPVSLVSYGGSNVLKGNRSDVSFVVQLPEAGAAQGVEVSLAQAGGSNNRLQMVKQQDGQTVTTLSSMLDSGGALNGIVLGANTDAVDYIFDLGDKGVVDRNIGLDAPGRNVTITGKSYTVTHDVTVDRDHTLRLEGQFITLGQDSGANILLTAGAIQVVAQSYRPWRSAFAQIYTVEADVTVKNATLWATDDEGDGIRIEATLDSGSYQAADKGESQSGFLGTLLDGKNKALEALKTFADAASAIATWAGVTYKTNIDIGVNAKLVSNSDISVLASNTVEMELSPTVAKVAGVAVGVLQNVAHITLNGSLTASKTITVGAHNEQTLTIELTPEHMGDGISLGSAGRLDSVPAVIAVGVSVVISDASVNVGSTAVLQTGLRADIGAGPIVLVESGEGGDITVFAKTDHTVTITLEASGEMASSDDTQAVDADDPASTAEKGRYNASYAKVGVAVAFAYNQINTSVQMDGKIQARDEGKVIVQAETADGGSAISVQTILGGKAATGSDYADQVKNESKSAVMSKVTDPAAGAARQGLGKGSQLVKAFFGALLEDSNSRSFGETMRDVKAKNQAKEIVAYDESVEKESGKSSTEFQVGAALGMAMSTLSTTVHIGDTARINTAGGDVEIGALTSYSTQFTVMSGVDDAAIKEKSDFLKEKNGLTTDQVQRNPGGDGSDLGAAGAVVISIENVKTRAEIAGGAVVVSRGGDISVSSQTLNQIDPDGLWLYNLYSPFKDIQGAWDKADGNQEKAGVAKDAGLEFLNNLQATLTSTGGISSSFSTWASATAKSKKLALSGAFTIDVQATQTQAIVSGELDTRAAAGDGAVNVTALNSTQRMNLVGNIILPQMEIGGTGFLSEAGPRGEDQGRLSYGKEMAKGFLKPTVSGFDYGSGSKEGSAIGVSVYVKVATHDTQALVSNTARIRSGDLTVDASNELISVTVGASGGQAKTMAVNGVVLVNVTSATTVAQVGRGAVVNASGKAAVVANDATWVGTVAGAVARSETVGIGMSVGINSITRDTQALIGQRLDDSRAQTGPAGEFSAAELLISAHNKGFVGNLAVSGSRVSTSPPSSDDAASGDVLSVKAPPSQGGATPGAGASPANPGEVSSLSDILKQIGASTSTLTQDAGGGSGGADSKPQSKTGVALAGSVAANIVNDFAQAYVNAAGLALTIGGAARIEAQNTTHALALSGAMAQSKSDTAQTNVGIAGAFGMNVLSGQARAEVALAGSLIVAGDLALSARRQGVAATLAAGLAGASGQKGIAVAGSVALTVADYSNIARLGNVATIKARDVQVTAKDSSVVATVAGSGAVSEGKAGVGAAVAVNVSNTRVEAAIRQATDLLYTGKVSVSAESSQVIVGFAGALGKANDGAGLGGSVTVNVVGNRIESYILNSSVRYGGARTSGSDVHVEALDKTTLVAVTGAAGVGKKAGVGIAISYNQIANAVLAGVQGSTVNTAGGGLLSITAEDRSALGGGAVGVGVGTGQSGFAGAGSVQVNRLQSAVAAYVLPRYSNNTAVPGSSVIQANAVTVRATGNATLVAVTGGAAMTQGGTAAVGASVSVNEFSSRTSALIEHSNIDVKGKVDVSAHASPLMVSVGAAGALAKKFALAGAVNVNMMRGATEARISDSTVAAGQSAGFNGQAVRVNASDASALYAITVAGAVALEGAAAGLAVAVNIMGGNTAFDRSLLSFDDKQLADSGAQVQLANVAENGDPATHPKVTAAIVRSDVRATRGDVNVFAGLVDPLAAGGNAQLSGGDVLAVNDGDIRINQGGSSLVFDGLAAEIINGKDVSGSAGLPGGQSPAGGEFSGWQTGDGIYLSAGAGNIRLADGSSLSADRVYYIIRRTAPDGQAIIQLAATQEDALRGKALEFAAVQNVSGIRFAHVRMQEANTVNLQPFHGADATVDLDQVNNRLIIHAPFEGLQEGAAIIYSGSLANGKLEDVLAHRIVRQGQDVLAVGVSYYVSGLVRTVDGQVSFQLRDGQGKVVDLSGATVGGELQRFSVDNPAGGKLSADGSLTLPKAHGLANGDKVVIKLGANGVLTGLNDDHVYVVQVIDSVTLRFSHLDGSAVSLAELGYVAEFNTTTGRYSYYRTDAEGNKQFDGQGKPIALNPDALIGITRVQVERQTSESRTTTKSDGTEQTTITQGQAQDATLRATQIRTQVAGENSLRFGADQGLATGDLVVYRSQGRVVDGLVDGERYYVINVSGDGGFGYRLASSLQNARDGIAIALGAGSGSGGISLQKVVNRLDSGGLITLDIAALTQGHSLTNSMLSITVAGAGGKSLGGAGAIGVNLSRTEVQAVIDNTASAAQVNASSGRLSVSAQDSSRIVTATGALGVSLTQGTSAAIGASVGVADIRNGVKAAIRGTQLTAQAVQVSAEARASIYNVSVGLAGGAGVAVSGSLAVNTLQNTVQASITDATIRATTGDIRILARDTASISALAGNVAVSAGGRVAAGMAFAVNRVFDTVYAGALRSSLVAAGDIVLQSTFGRPDDLPPGLDAQIAAMAVSGAVAVGGSGANVGFGGSAVLNWIANTITAEVGETAANQAVSADRDLLVQANDSSTINSLAGAVALGLGSSGASVAVGASLAYNYVGGSPLGVSRSHAITAHIRDTEGAVRAEHVQVTSLFSGAIHNVTVAGSVAVGTVAVSVGGSVSINRVNSRNEAGIRNARLIESLAQSGSVPGVAVHAGDEGYVLAVAGGLGVAVSPGSGVGIAAGVAATDNEVANHTLAYIHGAGAGNAAGTTRVRTQTGLAVEAINASQIVSATIGVATSVAAGQGFAGAGAGAGSGNTIAGSVEASLTRVDMPSSATLNQGEVRVSAENRSRIVTVAGALGLAVSAGGVGAGASIGVSVAISHIATVVRAKVEDAQLRLNGSGVRVSASDTASITAIAVGGAVAVQAGAGGVAIAVGTSVAVNKIFNTVEATISGSSVATAGGQVVVNATQQADILAVVLGASVAVSAGSSLNAAIGGGGALARNVISASVHAQIHNAVIDTSGAAGVPGALLVEALGLSRINAVVLGMSASVSVSQYAAASAAIGVAMAENVIGYDVDGAGQVVPLDAARAANDIVAAIDNSRVIAGAVTVDARNVRLNADGSVARQQTIDAVVVAGAVAVSVAYAPPVVDGLGLSVSGAGAGARAVNKIQTRIVARISDQGQALPFKAGSVSIKALDQAAIHSTIAAVAVTAALSLGLSAALSVAASLAQNEINNAALAAMDGVSLVGTPAVTVKADSQARITTVSVAVSVSVSAGLGGASLAGGGANAFNLIGSSATALVNGASISGNGGNALVIDARMQGNIEATVVVASVGFTAAGASLAIGASLAENVISETAGARAGLTHSRLSNLGAVSVAANSVQGLQAKVGAGAVAVAMQGVAIAGAGASAFNTSRAQTQAYVDDVKQIDPNVRAAASLAVRATNSSVLQATAIGASAAGTGSNLALSVGAALARNKSLGDVRASVDNSILSSGAGAQMASLTISANNDSKLDAKAVGASLAMSVTGGSVAIGATDVSNIAASRVQAQLDGSIISVSDSLSVASAETTSLNSVAVAASVAGSLGGVALSGAGAGSQQVVANEVSSRVLASSVHAGTGVSVTADNHAAITAVTGAVSASVSGVGLGGSMGLSLASNRFGAYAGDGLARHNGAQAYIQDSQVEVKKGNVNVLASSSETLSSVNFAGALAVVGAGVSVAASGVQVSNRFATRTSAYIQGSTVMAGLADAGGSLTVRAKDDSKILKSTAYGVAASVVLAPGAAVALVVSLVDTVVENVIQAYLDTAGGKQLGAYDTLSVQALENVALRDLEAVTASISLASSPAGAISLSGAGAGVRVSNNTSNEVSARITGNGQVGALGLVSVLADTKVLANIDLTQVSIAVGAIGAAVGVGIAENIARDKTTARVAQATVSAPVVDVNARVAVDFGRTQTAGVAATTGLAVNTNLALVDIATQTLAEARDGAVLNGVRVTAGQDSSPGMVNVHAQGSYFGRAYAKSITGGVVGVGVMSAETRLGGSLKAVADNASLTADVVGVMVDSRTDRNGVAGLQAEARSLEVGGLTVSVDSAKLTTNLDAGVEIRNGARVKAALLSLAVTQSQSVNVSMDAGTIALVAGRQGKISVDLGGRAYVGISTGAQVVGNKVDIRANQTIRGESALSAYSVKAVGADVSRHEVTIRPQSVIEVSGSRSASDTIDSAGMTVVQAQGNYDSPGMLDLVATNDITYVQRNKITGVSGFTVTWSSNHLSTEGTLAQVKVNGAFLRNTFGDVTLATNTRGVTTTISDMLVVSVSSASKTDSNNNLTVRNSIEVNNASIEGDNVVVLAGSGKATDPLSTGYLIANDTVSFTMVGVAQVPLVGSGATARQINTIVIDGAVSTGSLIKAQRNVRLETNPSSLDQAQVNGSVQVIGLNLNPTVKLASGVVDKRSSLVATSAATRIIAGVNNAANIFVIPAELLKGLQGLTLPTQNDPKVVFDANSPLVRAIIEKLLGANSTSLDGAGGTVNIDMRYELTAFRAEDIEVNVSTGMVIKKGNDYYYYDSLDSRNLNLATENFGNSYWKKNPSTLKDADREGALPWDFGQFAADKVGSIYYVLKTVDLGQPVLRYGSQQNIISEQIRTLTRMQASHASDPQAVARYQANILALQQQLQSLQMVDAKGQYLDSFQTFYVEIPNLYASGGSVYVNAADVSGVKAQGIETRANTQINVVNDSPMLMNVQDAVVMDGTIIRPGSDGEMKVFKTGHLYVNDLSVKGSGGAGVAEVRVLQMENGWAADPFGGALDAEMRSLMGRSPVDLNLLGAVVNPLGKVSVVNALGSINVSGTISAQSLDIQAKGNFSLQSEGWFNSGADPTLLQNSWQSVINSLKNNSQSTSAKETDLDVLLKWGYQNLGSFASYLNADTAARDSRIFALGAVNIAALTLNIDGKIQSGVTDAYIRIDASFQGDRDKSLQDNSGYASRGVSYSADGSMKRFGAITGRFDYATQTIILDPVRLAGGSITLTGQIVSVGNGNLIVANGYASVHIDNQTNYALVTGDIDVSTYRRGRIDIVDTARGQRDLYELNGQNQVVHTVWNKFVQVSNPGLGQPGWVWVYDNGQGVRDGKGQTALVGSLGNALTTTYKPAAGQVMVWVMGWDSSNTATTIYVTKNLNLIGENVDPLGWLTDRNTTKTGPTVI